MKFFNTSILLGIYLLVGCLKLQAQNIPSYNVKHYDIFDGLSNNWVSDIFQDKDGFIWFGTQYGLNRFDGKKFKIFTYVPGDSTSIQANWVRSIEQLKDHKIYVGTLGGGVNVLDPYKETFSKLLITSDSITDNDISQINNLVKDTNDDLWISSTVGAFQYFPKNNTLEKRYNKNSSNISISEDESIRILGRQRQDIYEVRNETIKKLHFPQDQKILNLFSITKDSTLVYTTSGLTLVHRSNDNWLYQKINFETTYSSSVRERPFIFKDNQGFIWINGGEKVYKFSSDLKLQDSINLRQLLDFKASKHLKANSMFHDIEGNYWIGTNLGVFQLIAHKPLRHPILGSIGKVREIEECGNRVWFALSNGIYVWNKNSNQLLNKINEYTVTSIKCASDGFLYTLIRYENGQSALLKIDPITEKTEPIFFPNVPFSMGVSWRIIEDLNQRLWIAQWDNIIIYDLKDQSYFTIPVFKKDTGIIELYPDNQDNIWIGSIGKGLLKFSNASTITKESNYKYQQFLHKTNDPSSISSNLIQSIHQSNNNLLWIGTDGGLNSLDLKTEKFQRFLRNDQMPNDKILNITSDKTGIIWLSTISHGIISYNPNTRKYSNYIVKDGIYDNSMVLSSVYQNREGFIWMGSEGGVQYFHPDQLTSSKKISPNLVWLSYTKYQADTTLIKKFPGKGKKELSSLNIYPEDQNISFQFQALTFEKPENVRYHFKLKGYHNDWLPAQENGTLTLSYLPKGSYQLLVKTSSDDQWEITYSPIPIVVVPPWYKTNLAYTLDALTILFLIFIVYRIQLRRKIAETEKEFVTNLSKAKTRWFNQIAHEFRTPLTVILGAADQIRDRFSNNTTKKTDKHLSQIEDQANHLSNQVHQILEIAQMQDNQLEIYQSDGDFVAFQRYLLRSFTSLAEKDNITLDFSSSHQELYLSFDEDKWRKITTNLISNAIKYNTPGGKVSFSIRFKEQESLVTLEVKDTGIGIKEKFIPTLFDPFTKEKIGDIQGVGLGLTLTKELVHLLKGKITVQSQKGKGTTFIITAPVTVSIDEQEILDQDISLTEDTSIPIILVAEDHKEVRDYIQFCLSSNYKVLQANNGLKAWKLCEKHLPDLVISDVMMPKLDGIQLGVKIRENVATNHIPLILLTAKSGHDNQIEGLKIGADAYVNKPFDREELLIRVNNLINTRQKLREKYQQGDIEVVSENETIDSFMKTVIQTVQDHLDNDQFGVPQLADHLHISRVHLFRKIKNLTGMSPTKFIRTIKLQRAKELLKNNEFTIAEIAYQIGFKDPAYFTRVYVEEFGVTPTQSRNKTL
ncbi:hybrid sensor histidine kinase/response regulator transcription factor [Aquimarina sp. 2201CG5-10]|uniref:hybrid sensor histidine kinase/response regulator transcription factor n=1 Tax=Aquimarina callyspongiae TaxID=3098150 RepID=UPI002AB408CE|nr:ATP-binding protein [Aquimarina sp. 2201CG5-10]MDY8135097.1 response regulator [Aquimarina sp. 2201CG5-10]